MAARKVSRSNFPSKSTAPATGETGLRKENPLKRKSEQTQAHFKSREARRIRVAAGETLELYVNGQRNGQEPIFQELRGPLVVSLVVWTKPQKPAGKGGKHGN